MGNTVSQDGKSTPAPGMSPHLSASPPSSSPDDVDTGRAQPAPIFIVMTHTCDPNKQHILFVTSQQCSIFPETQSTTWKSSSDNTHLKNAKTSKSSSKRHCGRSFKMEKEKLWASATSTSPAMENAEVSGLLVSCEVGIVLGRKELDLWPRTPESISLSLFSRA
ncbi:unnamed protein product [Cercospora beticola]|nr:unnamed protein product [Cercospora beticola]